MAEIPRATYYPTGPDYPRTMQIPLLRGRFLTAADNIHSQLVCLIDSLLARTYFPESRRSGSDHNDSPLGRSRAPWILGL